MFVRSPELSDQHKNMTSNPLETFIFRSTNLLACNDMLA